MIATREIAATAAIAAAALFIFIVTLFVLSILRWAARKLFKGIILDLAEHPQNENISSFLCLKKAAAVYIAAICVIIVTAPLIGHLINSLQPARCPDPASSTTKSIELLSRYSAIAALIVCALFSLRSIYLYFRYTSPAPLKGLDARLYKFGIFCYAILLYTGMTFFVAAAQSSWPCMTSEHRAKMERYYTKQAEEHQNIRNDSNHN